MDIAAMGVVTLFGRVVGIKILVNGAVGLWLWTIITWLSINAAIYHSTVARKTGCGDKVGWGSGAVGKNSVISSTVILAGINDRDDDDNNNNNNSNNNNTTTEPILSSNSTIGDFWPGPLE